VARCQAGDREAFGFIVARYQSLLCSIAYSATGDLKLSEDLAQESLLIAWRQMRQMRQIREPARLKSWLCSVARSVLSNWFRREKREPMARAESIDNAHEKPTSEPIPSERTITQEEETILWQTLQQIPEAYREPLILFYREGESVERVAAVLDISENAAKQRLSRGRKLLHEKVLALVEGGLRQSIPGKVFTVGVMAALPGAALSAKAATLAAATKAGTTAKAAGASLWSALLAVGPVVLVGGWIGRLMVHDEGRGPQQLKWVTWVWRMIVGVLIVVGAILLLLVSSDHRVIGLLFRFFRSREGLLATVTISFGTAYLVVLAALGTWLWRRRRVQCPPLSQENAAGSSQAPLIRWVVQSVLAASVILGTALSDSNWGSPMLSPNQVQELITKRREAQFAVFQWHNGSRRLWITVSEGRRQSNFVGPADEDTLARLTGAGRLYPIYMQGRDFEVFGWAGRLLPLLCAFILAAGIVVLLFHPKFAFQRPIMKAITAGIIGAAIALAVVGTAHVIRQHKAEQSAFGAGDPFQMKELSNEENARYVAMSPDQATRAFFEACGRGDWNEVDKFCAGIAPLDEQFKAWLTGVTVVNIGQSFTRPSYPGTYVPYEIRFKNGETKKFNLAIRRDNPQGRWMFDGGL
jgi:RNA polymerase sigma factor (sigma-70 family)